MIEESGEVKLTSQHQITIPKRVCERLHLRGGDRLEIAVTSDRKLLLKPKKSIDADDAAYRLGKEILDAEQQIKRGEVVSWSEVKRRHRL
ncbi:MAG: AbrB/MazE/SpoVT family DNA-binding domain-containing protein [Candidatus Omnitrophota bacterium]|nr:AbrB/MazE/SpoVT family DNA-binding domain-containing protein [Candidatus Omnitrophota bacterium]